MWIVIYMSKNKQYAQKLKNILENAGLLVKLRSTSKTEDGCYEILVPETEVDEAHSLIINDF